MAKIAHPILQLLGATIRSLRAQRKLSQEALADRAAIDRSYMSGIERGLRNISVLHAIRIAKALDVSLSDLLRFDSDRSQRATTSPWLDDLVDAEDASALDEVPLAVSAGIGREADREWQSEWEVEWEVGRYLSLG